MTRRRKGARLQKRVARLVERERVCRVATAGPAGRPHVVPVCHVLDDGKLYFASDGTSKKIEHVRRNPYVAVTVDLYTEDWGSLRGVMIQGSAALIDRGSRFRKIRDMLYQKYPQYPEESALDGGAVVVEVTPRHVFTWGLE